MLNSSKPPAPMMVTQARPSMAPPPEALTIGPQISQALKALTDQIKANPQIAGGLQMPIDRASPEYKQAMLQQLASTGPMGAVGSVLHQWGDARKKQAAEVAAWAPTVTAGE